ncbi:hypothetical protein G6F56_011373 [Rhizopus delemar]|nr:hypothetical protein G6F56_011373 [Rhizopus delemar]
MIGAMKNLKRFNVYTVRENNDYSCTTFNKTDSFFNDDIYLQPILEDDPFLFAFDEDCEDSVEETLDLNKIEPTTELEKKLTSLLLKSQQDLESLQEQFDDYKLTVKKTFYDTLEDKN